MTDRDLAPTEIGATSTCQHVRDDGTVCGLPIELVESHSTQDCSIEGSTWWHDAESVPDGIDPCDAYDANDDHDGVPTDA